MPLQPTDVPSRAGIQAAIDEARDLAFAYTDERTTDKPYASLLQTATQNMVQGATTSVTWDTIETAGGMTAAAAGATIPETGRYRITPQVGLATTGGATGIIHVAVVVNGSTNRVVYRSTCGAVSPTVVGGTVDLDLSQNQVVTVGVYHTNGANRTLYGGTTYATTLTIEKID